MAATPEAQPEVRRQTGDGRSEVAAPTLGRPSQSVVGVVSLAVRSCYQQLPGGERPQCCCRLIDVLASPRSAAAAADDPLRPFLQLEPIALNVQRPQATECRPHSRNGLDWRHVRGVMEVAADRYAPVSTYDDVNVDRPGPLFGDPLAHQLERGE